MFIHANSTPNAGVIIDTQGNMKISQSVAGGGGGTLNVNFTSSSVAYTTADTAGVLWDHLVSLCV